MKLDDEQLLDILRRKEESAGAYVWGDLGREREQALREYHRLPYGNEQDGWSQIVASDIQDTVEWILPSLLKVFSSTDKAVSFEPSRQEDVQGAEQATDACNYVFYKSNNGFLTLYTLFKDALTIRNCAVMWRKEEKETVSTAPFKGATAEHLAMILQEAGDDAEITESTPSPMVDQAGQPAIDPMTGQPVIVYSGRIKRTEKKTVVKVEAFSPEDLLVDSEWTSPILRDCPYVARMMRVTASDLKQMGFDVTAADVRASDGEEHDDDSQRLANIGTAEGQSFNRYESEDDDSMADGWLRIEFVLVDVDGDGIAERRCVYRLKDRILKNDVVSHVPMATFSPILNPHRWDGQSMSDAVADLQRLHTELLRGTLDNLRLVNAPRSTVLTDANWSPLANIDDLLDGRAGGIVRQKAEGAVQSLITPFAAGATMPMLQYVQDMRAKRTGVSEQSQGLNPDSLQNQAGAQANNAIISAAAQRVELIARIAAEVLLKPIFQGILKLLTDGGMEKLAFRLRNEFVEYDPNEWRDQYDMTINVGLGTGDSNVQAGKLQMIMQNQMALLPMGLTTPKNIYHTQSKIIENAGYKDVQNFLTDPNTTPPQPQGPPLEVQLQQMKLQGEQQKLQLIQQADQQKFQAETQIAQQLEQMKAEAKQREVQLQLELQASNDMRDGQREQFKAEKAAELALWNAENAARESAMQRDLDKYKADLDANVKLQIAGMGMQSTDSSAELEAVKQSHAQLMTHLNAPRKIIRGPDGQAQAIDIGGVIKPIKRGANGRIEGI